jgi:hypothetical protein
MENPLAPDLIATILANEGLVAVIQFVQEHSPAGSELLQQGDYNTDGEITGTELLAFWNPENFAHLDKNSDNVITVDETGEAAWRFVADADHDEDGCFKLGHGKYSSDFARFDVDRDGQLSEDEWSSGPFDRFDADGNGKLSKTEFIEGKQSPIRRPDPITGPPAPPLTPKEKFASNDMDGDNQVTADEADGDFWGSIVEFDLDGDNAVDLTEYEQGLQQRNLDRAEKLWPDMDKDSDGLAGQEDVPSALWGDWIRFDTNGDNLLSKEEFLESQKRHDDQEDE